MISEYYEGTDKRIASGDRICIDVHSGTVVRVCLLDTQDARDFACKSTGGLLIDFDVDGLVLVPFGDPDGAVLLGTDETGQTA